MQMKQQQPVRAGSASDRGQARRSTPVANAPGSEGRLKTRPAFTLIEMLVVVSIILIITVAIVAVAPRFTDDRKMSRAADQIAQILLTAKQRAKRDQIPTGVRLFPDKQRPDLITELQYIQQPDDFASGGVTLTYVANSAGIAGNLPPGILWPPASWTGSVLVAQGTGTLDFTGGFGTPSPGSPDLRPVQPGDYLNIKGTAHLILAVFPYVAGPPPVPSTLVLEPVAPFQPNASASTDPTRPNDLFLTNAAQIAAGMFVTGPWAGAPGSNIKITKVNNLTYPPSITLKSSPNPAPGNWIGFLPQVSSRPTAYSIIRQPRVLTGETPLQLPAGICIDPAMKIAGDANGFTLPANIMFSPKGDVLKLQGVDSVILWVRDYTKDIGGPQLNPGQPPNTYPVAAWPPSGSPGDQFLVLIQTHTGFIAEHPVNTSPGGNPYLFTQDARSSGM